MALFNDSCSAEAWLPPSLAAGFNGTSTVVCEESLLCTAILTQPAVLASIILWPIAVLAVGCCAGCTLSTAGWQYRQLPYRVGFALSKLPAFVFARLTPLCLIFARTIVVLPAVVAVVAGINVAIVLAPYYPSLRSPIMAAVSTSMLTLTILLFTYGMQQFKNSEWHLTLTVKALLSGALACFSVNYVAYYCIVYAGVPFDLSGSSYSGVATVFLLLNMIPLTFIEFQNTGTGLPIDWLRFLKSNHPYRSERFVIRVREAVNDIANGVYVKSPEVSDGVPVYKNTMYLDMVIKRVRVSGAAFWVLSLEDSRTFLYGFRSDFETAAPPGGIWAPIAGPSTSSYCPAEPGPVVTIEDQFLHDLEERANDQVDRLRSRQRWLVGIMYFIAFASLLGFSLYIYYVPCIPNRKSGWIIFGLLFWVEVAQTMRLFAGVRLNPIQVTIVNLLARVILILAGEQHWFIGACVVYLLFAVPVAVAAAWSYYPAQEPREVIRQRLVGVLPRWMYIDAGNGVAVRRNDSFLHEKILRALLFSPFSSITNIFNCRNTNPDTDPRDAERKSAAMSAVTVLLYLAVSLGLCTAWVSRETAQKTKFAKEYLPAISFITETTHQQWEVGAGVLALSIMFLAYAAYLWAYRYYGHRQNRLPHPPVMHIGILSFVLDVLVGVLLGWATNSHLIGSAVVTIGSIAIVGAWGYANWIHNDFLFCQNPNQFRGRGCGRCIAAIRPDLSGTQFRRDKVTWISILLQAAVLIAMGIYLQVTQKSTSWWLAPDLIALVLAMFCLGKQWLNTYRWPWYPFVGVIGLMVATSLLITNAAREHGQEAFNLGYQALLWIVMPFLGLQTLAFFQWADNKWRIRTRAHIAILVAANLIGAVAITFVELFLGLLAKFASETSATTVTHENLGVLITWVQLLIGLTYALYIILLTIALTWANNRFRLNWPMRIIAVLSVLGYVVFLARSALELGFPIRVAVEVCLAFAFASLLAIAIPGLYNSDENVLSHTPSSIFPQTLLNTVTNRLAPSNTGPIAYCLACLFALWWAMFETLLEPPQSSDLLSCIIVSIAFVSLCTFILHRMYVPQYTYYQDWLLMKQFPSKLYAIRDQVFQQEGVTSRVGGRVEESKADDDGDEARGVQNIPIAELQEMTSDVPQAFPAAVPCLDHVLNVLEALARESSDYPPYYIVSGISTSLCGVYVRTGMFGGVPSFSLMGAVVPTILRRQSSATGVGRDDGLYWVLLQPQGVLYYAQVDVLPSRMRQAAPVGALARVGSAVEEAVDVVNNWVRVIQGGTEVPLTPDMYRKYPPSEPSDWMSNMGPAGGPGAPAIVSPVIDSWLSVRTAVPALMEHAHRLTSLRREEARLLARFQLMLQSAAAEQQERERRVVWAFVLEYLKKQDGQINLNELDRTAGNQVRSEDKRHLGSLSAYEITLWADKMFDDLKHRGDIYARNVSKRREAAMKQQIEDERSAASRRAARPIYNFTKDEAVTHASDSSFVAYAAHQIMQQRQAARMQKWRDRFAAFMNPSELWRPSQDIVYPYQRETNTRLNRQLFYDGADPSDIFQSDSLGDCWLLSAIAVVASGAAGTARIQRLVVHNADADGGDFYVVRLFHAGTGTWVRVVVDDFFRVKPTGEAFYAHSHQPETWVMVLEKAYAKFCGRGYPGLESGLVHEGLVSLTGGASEEIDLHDTKAEPLDLLWQRLVRYKQSGFLMGAGSPAGSDTREGAVHGIVQGHAYAILDLRSVKILGRSYRMVNLRNPWGTNPWVDEDNQLIPDASCLDWFPQSSLWIQQGGSAMRSALDYDPHDDDRGKFWMTFEDFHQQYATVFVCRMLDEWHCAEYKSAWNPSFNTGGGLVTGITGFENPQFLVQTLAPMPLFISLRQLDGDLEEIMTVMFEGSQPVRQPLTAAVTSSPTFISTGAPVRQPSVSKAVAQVAEGKYILIPFTFFPVSRSREFILQIYTPKASADALKVSQVWPQVQSTVNPLAAHV